MENDHVFMHKADIPEDQASVDRHSTTLGTLAGIKNYLFAKEVVKL